MLLVNHFTVTAAPGRNTGSGSFCCRPTDSAYILEESTDSVIILEGLTDSSVMLEGLDNNSVRVCDKKLFAAFVVQLSQVRTLSKIINKNNVLFIIILISNAHRGNLDLGVRRGD